jgi:hypothetical protein
MIIFLFISIYILSIVLVFLAVIDDQQDKALPIFYSLFPGLGQLLALFAIYWIIIRVLESRGQCFLGHDYHATYDSEQELWKNGRMPLRISIGGYTKYSCSKCGKRTSTRWSAF